MSLDKKNDTLHNAVSGIADVKESKLLKGIISQICATERADAHDRAVATRIPIAYWQLR